MSVRIGMVGLGQRGLQHLKSLWHIDGARIVALYDPFPDILEEAKLRSFVAEDFSLVGICTVTRFCDHRHQRLARIPFGEAHAHGRAGRSRQPRVGTNQAWSGSTAIEPGIHPLDLVRFWAVAEADETHLLNTFFSSMNSLVAVLAANVSDQLDGRKVLLEDLLRAEEYARFRGRPVRSRPV